MGFNSGFKGLTLLLSTECQVTFATLYIMSVGPVAEAV